MNIHETLIRGFSLMILVQMVTSLSLSSSRWIKPINPFLRNMGENNVWRYCSTPGSNRCTTTSMNMLSQRFRITTATKIDFLSINRVRQYPTNKKNPFSTSSNGNSNEKIIFMMAADDDNEDTHRDLDSEWNIPGLKKEAARLTLRCHKKIGKASERLKKAMEQVEEIRTDPNATLEELEACPNIKVLEDDLNELRKRLSQLNLLEEKLQSVKGKGSTVLPSDIASLAVQLDVSDEPPKRQPQGKKKKKGPRVEAPRKPYFRYFSNDVEIRVGRRATDNDELSCNPEHRDGADWWMHASGCPGSHVVIRCHDESLEKEVIRDAASLAARESKCQGSMIKVSLTRCRHVKKPPNAKPGLVQLTGAVQTISVNMKEAEKRLTRLDETKQIN